MAVITDMVLRGVMFAAAIGGLFLSWLLVAAWLHAL